MHWEGVRDCCRYLGLVLEPNLGNQIAARVALVEEDGVKEAAEDGEGRETLYHGYVEGENIKVCVCVCTMEQKIGFIQPLSWGWRWLYTLKG